MKEPHVMSVIRSIPLIESTGSYVMVVDTANLKTFIYGLPNIKLLYIKISSRSAVDTKSAKV